MHDKREPYSNVMIPNIGVIITVRGIDYCKCCCYALYTRRIVLLITLLLFYFFLIQQLPNNCLEWKAILKVEKSQTITS